MAPKGASKGKGGGIPAWSGKTPQQPSGPPPSKMVPTAKGRARPQAAPAGSYYNQPQVPRFFGAAGRKRAMDLMNSNKPGMDSAPRTPPGRKAAATPLPAPEPDVPPLMSIQLNADAPLVSQGLPAEAPVVHMSQALQQSGLLSQASLMLNELLGDDAGEVNMENDSEWDKFPEIGDAIKEAGGEERAFTLAICESRGCWAVGVGGNWKKREMATKLALCVQLAGQAEPEFNSKFADFANFAAEGILPGVGGVPPMFKEEPAPAVPSSKKRRGDDYEAAAAPAEEGALPRDVPLWMKLLPGEERPAQLSGVTLDEALLVCTDGNKKKALYNQAEPAIAAMLEDATDIEYIDDPNWDEMPAIGKAVKAMAPKEECLTVGVCPSLDIWAVGVGMKGKSRYAAVRLAMATSIAITKGAGEELEDFPSLVEFVAEAEQSK